MTPIVKIDPEILGGTPCFNGTRVPVKSLFDWLEHGHSLNYWLDQFPSVKRDQAIAILEQSRERAEATAMVVAAS